MQEVSPVSVAMFFPVYMAILHSRDSETGTVTPVNGLNRSIVLSCLYQDLQNKFLKPLA